MAEEWLTTRQAAEVSGYHPDHIRRLVRAKQIKAKKWGQAWMISRDSLLDYLQQSEASGQKRGPKSADNNASQGQQDVI